MYGEEYEISSVFVICWFFWLITNNLQEIRNKKNRHFTAQISNLKRLHQYLSTSSICNVFLCFCLSCLCLLNGSVCGVLSTSLFFLAGFLQLRVWFNWFVYLPICLLIWNSGHSIIEKKSSQIGISRILYIQYPYSHSRAFLFKYRVTRISDQ